VPAGDLVLAALARQLRLCLSSHRVPDGTLGPGSHLPELVTYVPRCPCGLRLVRAPQQE
jgi:hypothetical protein